MFMVLPPGELNLFPLWMRFKDKIGPTVIAPQQQKHSHTSLPYTGKSRIMFNEDAQGTDNGNITMTGRFNEI